MIESTLRFDDVEDIPGLLPLLWAVQRSHMRSRERNRRRPGNEANVLLLHQQCTIIIHDGLKTTLEEEDLEERRIGGVGH